MSVNTICSVRCLLSGGERTAAGVAFVAVCASGVAVVLASWLAGAAAGCCCFCCEACWTGDVVTDPGFPGSTFMLAGNTFGRFTPCNFLRTRWIAMENSNWSILPSALMSARFLQQTKWTINLTAKINYDAQFWLKNVVWKRTALLHTSTWENVWS